MSRELSGWYGIPMKEIPKIVMFTGVLTAMRYAKILDVALVSSAGSQYAGDH